ncbi:cytoplasmic protein [Ectobacillus ponti]|uniref:Cytoplasmic protein n=1 Tax=Ectobacillus ponti TaxID=2961894 RepID=A0AA41X7Y5_9BACI|nr:cytoplasmic protein [Ectobacillus ponti]MCP8968823.1 cytoplasmic protein [Ectobacillus ponti]
MYRTTVNGQEIIIKVSLRLAKESVDRDAVYESVLSIAERLLCRPEQADFAVHNKEIGLIIGEVQRGSITVFAVEHIIQKQNIFRQHMQDYMFEEGAGL